MPRLPLHIQSQIPASHFYFSCSGYLSTGLGNQTDAFSAGLVLFFFPLTKGSTRLLLLYRVSSVLSVRCQQRVLAATKAIGRAGLCLWDHGQPAEASDELPFYSALIRSHLKCYVQFWIPPICERGEFKRVLWRL